MMHNPLDSALFVPTLVRIAALLLVGAVLVAAAEHRRLRHPRSLRESTLFKRVLSWAMMAPTFALGVFVGGPIALLVVLYLIVQGVREFAAVAGLSNRVRDILMLLGPVTMATAVLTPVGFLFLPMVVFLLLSAWTLARGSVAGSYRELTVAFFGFMYLPLLLSFFLMIGRHLADGMAVLLLVGMSVALSDVCAFVVGKLVRGPRLAPQISPNKTVAGVAGSVAGAY